MLDLITKSIDDIKGHRLKFYLPYIYVLLALSAIAVLFSLLISSIFYFDLPMKQGIEGVVNNSVILNFVLPCIKFVLSISATIFTILNYNYVLHIRRNQTTVKNYPMPSIKLIIRCLVIMLTFALFLTLFNFLNLAITGKLLFTILAIIGKLLSVIMLITPLFCLDKQLGFNQSISGALYLYLSNFLTILGFLIKFIGLSFIIGFSCIIALDLNNTVFNSPLYLVPIRLIIFGIAIWAYPIVFMLWCNFYRSIVR